MGQPNRSYQGFDLEARRFFNQTMGCRTREHVTLPASGPRGMTLRRVRARKPYATPTSKLTRHSHLVREVFEVSSGPLRWIVVKFHCGASSWQAPLSWKPDARGVCAKCELAKSGVRTIRVKRGTSNSDVRGNSTQRRKRKQAVIDRDGDGTTVKCYRCSTLLDITTVTMDRIVPGVEGGKYTVDNCRASCSACATETGNELKSHRAKERAS